MGLTAVVFKSPRSLLKVGTGESHIDELTGEVLFEGKDAQQLGDVVALKRRLGNISRVEQLRIEVTNLLRPLQSSLLLTRVLYNGTHVGDVIGREHFDQLKKEISHLKKVETRSGEVNEFVAAMEDLMSAADQEGNPIAFV